MKKIRIKHDLNIPGWGIVRKGEEYRVENLTADLSMLRSTAELFSALHAKATPKRFIKRKEMRAEQ